MIDRELDDLGGLWRQEPDRAEIEALRRSAARIARRGRMARAIEGGFAGLIAIVALVIVVARPSFDVALMGGTVILILLISQMRQRRLREVELKSLTGSAAEMLDQSIARVDAAIRRNRFGLIGMVPALAVTLVFAHLAERRRGAPIIPYELVPSDWRGIGMLIAVLAVVIVVVRTIQAMRAGRREVERLRDVRRLFADESDDFEG